MVSLAPPPANWEEAILQTAITQMNAEVCFYEEVPGTTPYNPITGKGGATEVKIIWRGKARVQHLRAPRDFSVEYQVNSTRFFRYQLDPNDDIPFIPQGVKSRVLNGGRDADLEELVLVVNAAINSSHMAVRTVELAANMKPMPWDWEPPAPKELP